MQGDWTIRVKSKNASFPQRFIVSGADSGNGIYTGSTGTPAVDVTGAQWIIKIQYDGGGGFQLSNTRLKFPQRIGNEYVFDIQSNDSGNDTDFDDLVLTCSTPVRDQDYLIYGNVSLQSGPCLFRPCHYPWLVIDSYAALRRALDIDALKKALEKLYPERLKPFPPGPDPEPYFRPMIVNLLDDFQIPPQVADVYSRTQIAGPAGAAKGSRAAAEPAFSYKLERSVLASNVLQDIRLDYDRLNLSKVLSPYFRLPCDSEPGSNITLDFEEYDRTGSELAGNPYTGDGNRALLGSAITDLFGNYIFRFQTSFFERFLERFFDVAAGEDRSVQVRPDLIVKAVERSPAYKLLYESAPRFNVPNLKRIDICLPKSRVSPASFCFNGNLVGSLGNVFVGGNQNTGALTTPAALDRNGYNNHLDERGIVTVRNTQAGFGVDCACWHSVIDVKGCLFNTRRRPSDPIIRHYTIRYKKPGDPGWQFVTESYLHPQFSKRHIPGYNGDLVGPFPTILKIDGGPAVADIPAYKNIQAEAHLVEVDWEYSSLDRYIQLSTPRYEGTAPGTVYFRIDGYDASGTPVPGATDLIALYISNSRLEVDLGAPAFTSPIEYVACGLYKMTAGEMNTPLRIPFRVEDADPHGFVDAYALTFGKCPSPIVLQVNRPASIAGTNGSGVLVNKSSAANTDAGGCPGYRGSTVDFAPGFVEVEIQPDAGEGGWLKAAEEYGVFSVGLTATRRVTNGYNSGLDGNYPRSAQFSIIRK